MAGIPGKGGVKGRSGAPMKPAAERKIGVSLSMTPALRDRVRAAGNATVIAILEEALP
jgi:hypothetical protein